MIRAIQQLTASINEAYKNHKSDFLHKSCRGSNVLLKFLHSKGIIRDYKKQKLKKGQAVGYLIFLPQSRELTSAISEGQAGPRAKGISRATYKIQSLIKVARPTYVGWKDIQLNYTSYVNMYVFSTSCGLFTSEECVKYRVGGVLLFCVYL